MQRVDSSPDAQQWVASAIEVCTNWQPQAVHPARDEASPTQFFHQGAAVQCARPLAGPPQRVGAPGGFGGRGLTLAAAATCTVAWAVSRGALGIMPLAPLASRLIARAVVAEYGTFPYCFCDNPSDLVMPSSPAKRPSRQDRQRVYPSATRTVSRTDPGRCCALAGKDPVALASARRRISRPTTRRTHP